jgi:hypothetical protein
MMTEVSAKSLCFAFLGTGTMVAILKHVGTADWDRERLNMPVNTLASLSAEDAARDFYFLFYLYLTRQVKILIFNDSIGTVG